jgi:biotin transport system substrate-specific component
MATAATLDSRPDRLVLADLIPGALARDAALVVGGAGLTGLAAQFSVHTPLTPVPFTLQTLAVLLTGAVLGSARGALSMVVYLLAGVAGVPWFAGHAHGWGGPSFGYVVGFIVAAGVVGELARRGNDRQVLSTVGLMTMGTAIVFAFGATWLGADLHVSAQRAVDLGVTPFLVGEALKLAVAGLVLPSAWRFARRLG